MRKLRLALIFGGRSQEHEISVMSARSVLRTVDKDKYEIIPFAISKSGYWYSSTKSKEIIEGKKDQVPEKNGDISSSLKYFLTEDIDLAFPLLHGPYGEDGKIQGLLDMLDIPYIGTGVLSSAVGMDKGVMKEIFSFQGLPQGAFFIINKFEFEQTELKDVDNQIINGPGYPCFIKPANMGSSIGVSKVKDVSELKNAIENAFQYDDKIVIEEFIKGREIECSVLGNCEVKASLPGEIRAEHDFYDYEAKYKDEATKLNIPAELDQEKIEKVQETAIKAFKAIDGRGFSRVDFFIRDKDKKIMINEVNTIPGFTKYSMYPKLWEVTGIGYKELIDHLVDLALEDR